MNTSTSKLASVKNLVIYIQNIKSFVLAVILTRILFPTLTTVEKQREG